MAEYYLNKEMYMLDLKLQHYVKKLREAFSKVGNYEKAKTEVFKNWPEYKTLFGTLIIKL